MFAAGSASRLTETVWPEEGLTRVPYRLFQDPQVYAAEQRALFQGPLWHFLCLAVEVANPGDFCTSAVGDAPVIVTRDADGEIYAFENRCAHRGALITLEQRGNVKDFSCVYHAWTYDPQGNLIGVAFKDGIKGKGGMPPSFCLQDHGPRRLRVAELYGLVFGSFSEVVPPLEEYLGEAILPRIEPVLAGRKPVVLGRYTQALPNNWKLYMENVKDSYHASILHLFFTTFELNRLSQRGGIIVDPSGGRRLTARPRRTPSTPSKTSAPRAATGSPTPHCCRDLWSLPTTSLCRSSPCSRPSCCSRSRTRLPCARSCRAAPIAPISTGR